LAILLTLTDDIHIGHIGHIGHMAHMARNRLRPGTTRFNVHYRPGGCNGFARKTPRAFAQTTAWHHGAWRFAGSGNHFSFDH
jgi:hypothetical protein